MNRPTRLLTVLAATAAIGGPASILLAPGAAAASTLFAYADGTGSPPGCPSTTPTTNGCSLGQALSIAVNGDTIDLGTGSSTHYNGNWFVDVNVTIQPAPGVTNPTLDGNGGAALGCGTGGSCNNAILTIGDANTVTVDGVTLTNGNSLGSGGAIDVADDEVGTLTVSNSTFTNNRAAVAGGAISNGALGGNGAVTVTDSTFGGTGGGQPNTAPLGGAIANGDTLTVHNSTFTDNSATTGGGAIVNASGSTTPTATITGSTFNGNSSADDGGAILNGNGTNGTLSVSTSTFSGNAANGSGQGGAIYNAESSGRTDDVTARASTFVGDTAGGSGPAIGVGFTTVGTVTVSGNLFAESCAKGGTWTDNGYNAGVDTTCFSSPTPGTGDVNNANVSSLGSLQNNGGPTLTRLPIAPNAAIGLIPDPTTGLCPRTDQRGFASSGACTAGAVEPNGIAPGGGGGGGGGAAPITVTVSSSKNPSNAGDPVTFTATLSPVPDCGSVSWLIDSVPPPAGTPTGGSGATWTMGPISSLSVGVHPVTAVFSGCTNFGEGNGTDNQEVDQPGTSTPTPTPTGSGNVVNPTIEAHVTSRHHRHHGWYRSPVHITFTCTQGSAPLTGPCPGPVVLRHDGMDQVVTRSITATDGGSDSVTLHINLDRTKPDVGAAGVRNGHIYHSLPTLKCVATDTLSGVASCTIVQHHHHIKGTDDVVYHYVAIATDNAGNKSKIGGSYTLS